VFAFFWLLIAILLELIALGMLFIFFYALIGAAGVGELIPEYDYAFCRGGLPDPRFTPE
jgi:hypothetical protein